MNLSTIVFGYIILESFSHLVSKDHTYCGCAGKGLIHRLPEFVGLSHVAEERKSYYFSKFAADIFIRSLESELRLERANTRSIGSIQKRIEELEYRVARVGFGIEFHSVSYTKLLPPLQVNHNSPVDFLLSKLNLLEFYVHGPECHRGEAVRIEFN